jgi:hypothetical protein
MIKFSSKAETQHVIVKISHLFRWRDCAGNCEWEFGEKLEKIEDSEVGTIDNLMRN